MPSRRRKHPALRILRDEILPSRRSSLQVNLSYVSNMSDSGNESFKSTQPENNISMGKKCTVSLFRNVSTKIPDESNVSVPSGKTLLSAMNDKETALGKSCQELKKAILNKTREIFDGKAELALKTATVLKGPRQALKEINEDSKTAGTDRNIISSSVIPDAAARNRSIERSLGDISMGKTLRSSSRVSKGNKSVILGGSDKYRDNALSKTTEKILMVSLTKMADPRLEMSMESNISEIGAPIVCSSFIAGHGNSDGPSSQRVENVAISEKFEPEGSTRNPEDTSLTTMEITAIQTRPTAPLARNVTKSQSRSDARDDRSSDQVIPMELTSVQSHIPLPPSTNSNEAPRTSFNVNTHTSVSSRTLKTPKRARSSANCKDNSRDDRTAGSSLNVNTSIDSEEQKTSNDENISCSEGNDSERSTGPEVEKRGTIISGSDTDSTDNMSLIERLRNISARKSVLGKQRSCVEEGPSFVEGTPCPPSRSILWRTQIRSETIRIKTNGIRLKQHIAQALTNHASQSSDSDSSGSSAEFTTAPNSTVIPSASPHRITCNTANPQIIEDSSTEDECLRGTNANPATPDGNAATSVPKKKKLLPLRDNFEMVSFSPVSAEEPTPKKPTTWMPRRHFRRRKLVRAVAEKRIETLLMENEDEDEAASCSSLGVTKARKGPSKAKKPRKVISKKIVVKKIANDELAECLGRKNSEPSIASERSSVNEFLNKKKLSVTGRNTKPQKLFLVATGFSKGDLDLVKSVVKELGGAEINTTVNRRTTHVVSTGVRTINLLRGIIRGCWMVSLEWVLKSLEKGKWLNAEQYEMVHFSKAVQENRRDRQIFGKAYIPELFTTCGPIHVEGGTSPPPEILKELVKTAGGRIADNPREARLSVGPNGLREIWILDSITTGDLQPVEEYHRK